MKKCILVVLVVFVVSINGDTETDVTTEKPPSGTPLIETHQPGVAKIYGRKLYMHCNVTGLMEQSDSSEAEGEPVSDSLTSVEEDAEKKDTRTQPLEGLQWFNTTGGAEMEILLPEDMEDTSIEMRDKSLYLTSPAADPLAHLHGTYECRYKGHTQTFRAIAALKISKFQASYAVTEREDLKIHCHVHEPYPEGFTLSWYSQRQDSTERIPIENNKTEGEEAHIKTLKDKDSKVPNAILKIEDAVREDRAYYFCVGKSVEETVTVGTLVRVKDKYAALWPFIGIVAEVIVLCIMILVCEKSHVKKEIEEEDFNGTNASGGQRK